MADPFQPVTLNPGQVITAAQVNHLPHHRTLRTASGSGRDCQPAGTGRHGRPARPDRIGSGARYVSRDDRLLYHLETASKPVSERSALRRCVWCC